MPPFPWLYTQKLAVSPLTSKIRVLRELGVPYPPMTPAQIRAEVDTQANQIVATLRTQGRYATPDKEIIALIAYLQKLGKTIILPPEAHKVAETK